MKNLAVLAAREPDSPKLADWSELLLDQALSSEGVVQDPARLVKRMQDLLTQASDAAVKGVSP